MKSSFLSIFDIEGSIFLDDSYLHSSGLEQDMKKLMQDQNALERDYKLGIDRVLVK